MEGKEGEDGARACDGAQVSQRCLPAIHLESWQQQLAALGYAAHAADLISQLVLLSWHEHERLSGHGHAGAAIPASLRACRRTRIDRIQGALWS
jgi:hypothetical protein